MIRISLPTDLNAGPISFRTLANDGSDLPDREIDASTMPLIFPDGRGLGRGSDAPGGSDNPVSVPVGRWMYGFLEKRSELTKGSDREDLKPYALSFMFDCIDIDWFELRSVDFDPFYPTNRDDHVDDQSEPSIYFLYADSTDAARARDAYQHITSFHLEHPDLNERHKSAVRGLHRDVNRFHALFGMSGEGEVDPDQLSECGWYILCVSEDDDAPGLPVENHPHDGASPVDWRVLLLFQAPPSTQRRLHRVISADFVPDTDFLGGGDGGHFVLVPPPTILSPSGELMPYEKREKPRNPYEIPKVDIIGATALEKNLPSWHKDPTLKPTEYDVLDNADASGKRRRVATEQEIEAFEKDGEFPDDTEVYFSDDDERSDDTAVTDFGGIVTLIDIDQPND
jgi:hypothetical protein